MRDEPPAIRPLHYLGLAAMIAGMAVFAVAGIDAAGAAAGESLAASRAFGVAVYLTALYGAVALPLAALLAILLRMLPQRISSPRVFAAGIGAGGIQIILTFRLILWADRFQNTELAALLVATASVLAIGALLGLVWLTQRLPQRLAMASAGVFAALGGSLFIGTLFDKDLGIEQVSPSLIAMPLVAGALLHAGTWLRHRLIRAWRAGIAVLVVIAVCCVAAAWMERTSSAVPFHAATDAPLGRILAGPIHAVTDTDGDGFSGVFGGGDCAPDDPSIAPNQLDVPGDGIDNNCVGGDAVFADTQGPKWHPMPAQKHDVVLVTIETLRHDRVGFMGYERDTTPNLDALAADAGVFERFWASSTFTRISLPSLLTSRAPSAIEWLAQDASPFPRIAPSNPWLPAAFADAGYVTAAFMVDFPAFTQKDAIGFDRGFSHYDVSVPLKYRGGTMRGFPSLKQLPLVTAWIDDQGDDKPYFLWLHLLEPHYLYERHAKAPKFGKSREDLYDSEVWMADRAVGELVDHLKKVGRWDKTIFVVTGDHGEEFEEHGKRYHGSNLHEPQARTPLLIRAPDLMGRRISEPASFVDLPPTMLNLAGVSKGFDEFEGTNLTPLLVGQPIPARPLFLEVWSVKSRRNYQAAVVSWPYKLIASGRGGRRLELFNLHTDPAEKRDLMEGEEGVAKAMTEMMHRYRDRTKLEYRQPQ